MTDIIIGAGDHGCMARIRTGYSNVSENDEWYWLSLPPSVQELGGAYARIYVSKSTSDGRRLTKMLSAAAEQERVSDYILELYLRHMTPAAFREAMERARRRGVDAALGLGGP